MTTYKGLGISIKYGDHSRKMELRVNQHALGVRVPHDTCAWHCCGSYRVTSGLRTILELPRAGSNRNPEFARLAQNEAAGCTMRTSRELKMEIPARDPTLSDFRNGLPPDGDFDRRPFCFQANFEEEICTDASR